MKRNKTTEQIIEKKLGIPADYQFKALTQSNFFQSHWHRNKFVALEYCLELNKKVAVLDLGAGSGNFELLFGSRLQRVTAVDYHQEALDFLGKLLKEKQIPSVELVHSDIRNLPTSKKIGKFDLIIMIDVIEHIRGKEADALLERFHDLLNPGGKVCIVTPNYQSPWVYIEKLLDKLTIVPHFEGQQHLAQYNPAHLAATFSKHGFIAEQMRTFNLFSFVSPWSSLAALLCRLELASTFPFGNLVLGVFSRKEEDRIDRWNKQYSSDQENLYKNPLIRMLFDLGHRYIAQKGRSIQGKVLDIGSGMGYHLQFEKITANREYICLDKDKTMLEKIRQPGVKKLVGTCGDIPLARSSVQLVIASHILEHLPKLDHDLREISRVMKANGVLLVVLPCDPGLLWKFLTYFTPSRWRLRRLGLDYDEVMRHEHVNSFTTCVTALKKQFRVVDQTYYPFFIPNFHGNLLCCLTLVKKAP